jgi:nucleoside phosphorylase
MAHLPRPQTRDSFEIAIICALAIERDVVEALLDEDYEGDGLSYGKAAGDLNTYTIGRMGRQHVVLVYMPSMGTVSATAVAANLQTSFQGIKVAFIVGICGGAPTTSKGEEILLGDVIISTMVVQIDFGRQYPHKFIKKEKVEDTLGRANPEIRGFLGKMSGHQARRRLKENTYMLTSFIASQEGFYSSAYPGPEEDMLYPADYRHKHRKTGCDVCNRCQNEDNGLCELAMKSDCPSLGCKEIPVKDRTRIQRALGISQDGREVSTVERQEAQRPSIHLGRMASSNQVMKSGLRRDQITNEVEVIGFEMESAGTWDYVPTVVVKGVCDYADSHKDKKWQAYAAATAAACTKAMLDEWRSIDRPVRSGVETKSSKLVKKCQCSRSNLKTPITLKRYLGQLSVRSFCQQCSKRYIEIVIWLPGWLAEHNLYLVGEWLACGSPSFGLKLQRRVPWGRDDSILQFCLKRDLAGTKHILYSGKASLYDVDPNHGRTALHVSCASFVLRMYGH